MRSIRKRLTYSNVMSSIAVFLVLGGGAAYAAKKIGSHQLKANSVTTAKIKRSAVTSVKIRNGTVKGEDINVGTTPFGRAVAKLRTTGPLALTESLQSYPLSPGTYTQGGEEDDDYVGALDVTFQPSCEAPRGAVAIATLDAPNLETATEEQVIGSGIAFDEGSGTVTKRAQIGTLPIVSIFPTTRFAPGADTNHTVTLFVEGFCENGSGITASSGSIDVIGTR
jgi:hypothetical protein